jgi:uncharacterized phage protein (TIGR02220 family)
VLDKLGAENHTVYRMAEEHVRLITNQLRSGVTELELRAVVAHCSGLKRFQDEGREYLTPETLFGPRTISRYLDAARSAYSDQLARHAPQPSLAILDGGKR